ncbi:MAG: hypothetical protein KGZ86_07285 [Candidatus Latescibacteria bacterium]|nr:hypothetical protein [Candidatus Latescibacterota bacterium]
MTVLIITSLLFAQTQVSVSPMLIEQKLAPGARKQFAFSIVNESKWEAATLVLYPSDIIETEQGYYQTVEPGKGTASCASWIRLKEKDKEIFLPPDSGVEVVGSIEVPKNARGGGYGAIAIETKLPPNSKQYRTRTSVIIQIAIQPTVKAKAIITNIKIEPPEKLKQFMFAGPFKDALAIAVSVKNEGEAHITAKGTLILRHKNGGKFKEYPLGAGRGIILPNTTVDMTSVIKEPPTGEYLAEAIVRFGSPSPAKAVMPFTIAAKKVASRGKLSATTPVALTVKPDIIESNIAPNAFRTRTIILHNEEQTEIKVSSEIQSLANDLSGELITSDADNDKWTCANWIQIEPKELVLKPNERKSIKAKFQIPSEASQGERYAQIIFNVGAKDRLATPFLVPVFLKYPQNFTEAIKIDKVEITNIAPATFNVFISNIGDVRLKPTGKIILESITTSPSFAGENIVKVGEYPLKEIKDYVLPDQILQMEAEGPARLAKGRYNVKVEIEYGERKFSTFAKEIRI